MSPKEDRNKQYHCLIKRLKGKTVKIADYLVKRAEENVGQLYLFDPTMTIVDYTGDTCGLCGKSDSEILALQQPGMHTWELPNYYLLFLENIVFFL